MQEPAGFRDFVVARSRALQRRAFLLTGDWQGAEDLVQTTLARVWPRWERIEAGAREAYVRRAMTNAFLAARQRRWSAERPTAAMIAARAAGDPAESVDTRVAVVAALRRLPPRQRAVVVLRHFDDLTEVDTARAMGCSVGTVKSQHARAVKLLRSDAALAALLSPEATQ